jgi:putative Ca2+/H+ antiporter (TMEM165/GDT1 family)
MDWRIFITIFISVFLAELGDKTQLATMLFAADKDVSRWTVFFASASALVVAAAIGVAAGGFISQYVSEKVLSMIAGIGFILIGGWVLIFR